MPKDYKNVNKKKKPPVPSLDKILPFVTGLSIGLLIAFVVFLYGEEFKKITMTEMAILEDEKKADVEIEETESLPEPTFDFYKILPNKKINISEWIAEEQEKENLVADDNSLYVFQVGSFKDYKAADQVKAKLALIGIYAIIQRVVINGQDFRHRVRIGPYKDQATLNATRKKLIDNNHEFMLLKLNLEELASNQ